VAPLFELLRRDCCVEQEGFHESFVVDLRAQLDLLTAEDWGIRRDEADRLKGTSSKVGYQEVYSGPEVTLCVFVLRKGAHIPLHDHPNMYVFGRLLFGCMRVISYDPEPIERCDLDEGGSALSSSRSWPPPGASWASLHVDHELGPEPTTYHLGPREGNVHELYAMEDCAFFDVVMPPYNPAAGRGCNYYALARAGSPGSAEGRLLLLPSDSGDFTTEALEYLGPRFDMPVESPTPLVRPCRNCLVGENEKDEVVPHRVLGCREGGR